MYTDYWELTHPPFANDSRPETFVPTRAAAQVISRLRYGLGTGLGASAMYGEAGVGKTRVARAVLREFAAANWLTAYLPNPFAGPRDILDALEPAAAASVTREDATGALQAYLLDMAAKKRPALIVADDVQAARGNGFLETLRTLLNLENGGVRALSLLLVGQAGMERKLEAASGFNSQLVVRTILEPMSPEETRLYILARLKAAGSRQGILTKQAAELVVEYSEGLPRQVNRLCEMSLVIAYGLAERRVTPEVIEMAAADLDMLPAEKTVFYPWPHPDPSAGGENEEADDTDKTGEEDILASIVPDAAPK